ncbi:MAG TPA: glycosyltransferase family 2 protein [Longimicrobium sp.]|jgi:hypothetical protein|uniref:glycosyltransferase family 2 protein n=1 Tax=Longimicrobium sp. TaxID=2029185 RepID=UPI002ED84ACC
MPDRPALHIVIVNWNGGARLAECLRSIASARRETVVLRRVTVVDNGSTDGSAQNLDGCGIPLHVVRNPRNVGFAAACNQGSRGCAADYLLLLNPDTRLSATALEAPVAFLEAAENAGVGICGVQLVDDAGRVSRTCARFPTPGRFVARGLALDRVAPRAFPPHFMVEWPHGESRAVDQVMGAFFLTRGALWARLGGFDERFFVYFEEVDYALRARAAGYGSYFLTATQVYHEGGASSGQVPARRLFYSLRSRILYSCKHFGAPGAALVLLSTLALEPWTRLALQGARGSLRGAGETLAAYGLLWRNLPRILAAARR